ncbi:MAG: GntR family transcriptional regulator [Betaproteobacteria bacterium]|nr:GntR family transcriptional regulator [Betaproteobacteria bacterium]
MREAIRLLEREGLATVLPRRGAVVTELSAHEVAELFEIRTALFALVVQKIAAALPPDLEAALESGIRRLEALATLPDGGSAYAETVYKLLIVVARSCDNLRLQQMLGALSLQTLRYSKLGLASVERRQKSVQLWRDTLDALKRGNVELAVKLSQQRIIESGAEALRSLA